MLSSRIEVSPYLIDLAATGRSPIGIPTGSIPGSSFNSLLCSSICALPHPPIQDADTRDRAHQALGDMRAGHVVHGGPCTSNKSARAGNNNCRGTRAQYNDNTSTTSAAIASNNGAVSGSQKIPACDCVWRGRRRCVCACAPRVRNAAPPAAARR